MILDIIMYGVEEMWFLEDLKKIVVKVTNSTIWQSIVKSKEKNLNIK